MPRIPIFKLGTSAEVPPARLSTYTPALSLEGLHLGIDNVRHDVWLSSSLTNAVGLHIGRLIAKFGNVEAVISAEAPKNIFSKVVPSLASRNSDLKPMLADLLRTALARARPRSRSRAAASHCGRCSRRPTALSQAHAALRGREHE